MGVETKYLDLLGGEGLIHPSVKIGRNVRLGRGVILEEGCSIGDNSMIGHYCVFRPYTVVGRDSIIAHLTVSEGWNVIGDRTLVHSQCNLTKGIIIEDDVFIASCFTGANDPIMAHRRRLTLHHVDAPCKIKRAVRIGMMVVLNAGVVVGENAVIGIGSVVTKNIPDCEVWWGCPASFRKMVPKTEII